jgi:hypothetical protein
VSAKCPETSIESVDSRKQTTEENIEMGWEADRVLEGIFQFGAPINIWKMQLDKDSSGDLGYYRIHMHLDNDAELASRLKMKMSSGPAGEFQRLIIMESPKTRSVQTNNWTEHYFYGAWLYSLQIDYQPDYFPFAIWGLFGSLSAHGETD